MSNVFKVTILFVVLAGILIACGVVFFNWTGNEDILPPALQDPVVAEAPAGDVAPSAPASEQSTEKATK